MTATSHTHITQKISAVTRPVTVPLTTRGRRRVTGGGRVAESRMESDWASFEGEKIALVGVTLI